MNNNDNRIWCLNPLCDEQPEYDGEFCRSCEEEDRAVQRKLTCNERLEGLADSGCDTWADYREEN